jgi:putative DNA primase/helicase
MRSEPFDFSKVAAPPKDAAVELILGTKAPEPFDWLWPGHLARRKVCILAGAPGTGKTTLAVDFMATISASGTWPDGTKAPQGSVIMWTGEDGIEDTLIPRAIAAGADTSRIHFVGPVTEGANKRAFDPATDLGLLRQAIEKIGDVALVILDPIVMVTKGDSHKNAETRRDLAPVRALAEETGVAVLGITHFTKGSGGKEPQERVIGSVAFAAFARLVMVAARTPPNEGATIERRVLLRAKSNIGRDDGGFEYSLYQEDLSAFGICASRVSWGVVVEGAARDVLAEGEKKDEGSPAMREAKEFLLDFLADGPAPPKEVEKAAREAGISARTLRRAKDECHILSRKDHDKFDGCWVWSISDIPTKMAKVAEDGQPQKDGHLRGGLDTFAENRKKADNTGLN